MNQVDTTIAKLRGLQTRIHGKIESALLYVPIREVFELFDAYNRAVKILRKELPDLFGELPERPVVDARNNEIDLDDLIRVGDDIKYIFTVMEEARSSNHKGGIKHDASCPRRVFISHGRREEWRKVQAHIEKDLHIDTLELAQEPNRGRDLLQKLAEEAAKCSYAVILLTGEDLTEDEKIRARQNVIHEIGYFQGKYGLDRVCLIYEDGTEMPSNIRGSAYACFTKGHLEEAFIALQRDLIAAFPD